MPTFFQALEECVGPNTQSPESGTEPKGGQEDFFSVTHSSAVWEGTPLWRAQNTVVMCYLIGSQKFERAHPVETQNIVEVCYLTGSQKFGENDVSNNVEIVNLPGRMWKQRSKV